MCRPADNFNLALNETSVHEMKALTFHVRGSYSRAKVHSGEGAQGSTLMEDLLCVPQEEKELLHRIKDAALNVSLHHYCFSQRRVDDLNKSSDLQSVLKKG